MATVHTKWETIGPELLELLVKLDTVLRGTGSFYMEGNLAAEVAAVIAKATGDE